MSIKIHASIGYSYKHDVLCGYTPKDREYFTWSENPFVVTCDECLRLFRDRLEAAVKETGGREAS